MCFLQTEFFREGKEKKKKVSQSSIQIILQSGSQGRFGFLPDKAYENSD